MGQGGALEEEPTFTHSGVVQMTRKDTPGKPLLPPRPHLPGTTLTLSLRRGEVIKQCGVFIRAKMQRPLMNGPGRALSWLMN